MSNELNRKDFEHFRGALRKLLGRADETSDRIEGESLDRGIGGLDALDIENVAAEAENA